LLDRTIAERWLTARGVYGFWPAAAEGDDVVVFADESRHDELTRFHFLRQQWIRKGRECYYSLADFVAPRESGRRDYLGAFAVTAGIGTAEAVARFEAEQDDYHAIMLKVLADRLAEAFAERVHELARVEWTFGRDEGLSIDEMIEERYRGIRPAWGYPSVPDHTEKRIGFDLMDAPRTTGIELTESCMMTPAASVCGLIFSHPESRYFAVQKVARDQVEDYGRRKGMRLRDVERWLGPNLAYAPDE